MGLLKKATSFIRSELNAGLDAVTDPSKEMDLSYEDMRDQLHKAQSDLATVVAKRMELDSQISNLDEAIQKNADNAKLAVSKGRDDLARNFILTKQTSEQTKAVTVSTRDGIKKQEDALTNAVRTLKQRVESFGTTKELTKAQLSASKAQIEVSKSLSGLNGSISDAGEALQRATQKASSLQHQAEAMNSLMDSGVISDPLDSRSQAEKELAAMTGSSSVDDELAELKKSQQP